MKCPSCYKEGSEGFCKKCSKLLFEGKNVGEFLKFDSPKGGNITEYRSHVSKISIYGAQVKYSLALNGNELRLTEQGGEYILKPYPIGQLKNIQDTPENEHLSMQMASQIFKLNVAPNARIQFMDNQFGYIVRRFDVRKDGGKFRQDDFAQLAGKTDADGKDYKYESNYEEIGALIDKYSSAAIIEKEAYFKVVLFNYIIGNGDAHLKNFSILENETGLFRLSPLYDVLCTKIHSEDTDFALDFFSNDYETESFKENGFISFIDFLELGKRLGLPQERVNRIILEFASYKDQCIEFIGNSDLSEAAKTLYRKNVTDRCDLRLSKPR